MYEGKNMTMGEAVLLHHGVTPHAFWRWTAPLVLLGFMIVCVGLNIVALTFMNGACVWCGGRGGGGEGEAEEAVG